MTAPNVLAIGSCRIFRPLRPLHKHGSINLLNYADRHWFTHTAAAARQYVDVIQGNFHIPVELREAALETTSEFPEDMSWHFPCPPDVVVVEVSTLKEHRIGLTELNAHKVYRIANRSGTDYRPVVRGETQALSDDHVLKPLVVGYTDRQKLAEDLLAVRQKTGAPLILVNHLYSETTDGRQAPERMKLTMELQAVGQEHAMSLYDTRPLILEHGIDVALADRNHYRPGFESLVAQRLFEKIHVALS